MKPSYDKKTYEGRKIAVATDGARKDEEEKRANLLHLIRTYAPAGATDGLTDDELLRNPKIMSLAAESSTALRDYEFENDRDNILRSVPTKALESLVDNLPRNEIGQEKHDEAYKLQKKYIEADSIIHDIREGGEGGRKRIEAYAKEESEKARGEMQKNMDSEGFAYLSEEKRKEWVEAIATLAYEENRDGRKLLEKKVKESREARDAFKKVFDKKYTMADYVMNNLDAELDKGGKEAESTKYLVDLMRYEGVDSPEKLAQAIRG